jgi:hypothetical protein
MSGRTCCPNRWCHRHGVRSKPTVLMTISHPVIMNNSACHIAGESTTIEAPISGRKACSLKCVRAELAKDVKKRSAITGFAKATHASPMRKKPNPTTTIAANIFTITTNGTSYGEEKGQTPSSGAMLLLKNSDRFSHKPFHLDFQKCDAMTRKVKK